MALVSCPKCGEDEALARVETMRDGRFRIRCDACQYDWVRGTPSAALATGGVQRTARGPGGSRRARPKATPTGSGDWRKRQEELRTSTGKRKAFSKLSGSAVYEQVVELNRAYLDAAVGSPSHSELERWAVSCLPSTTPGRQSAVSMRAMEVFVVHAYDEDPDSIVAFVILDGRSLDEFQPPGEVELEPCHYNDGPPTQLRATADRVVMLRCLQDPFFAQACRGLAGGLMTAGRTMQWRGHNFHLADAILGRTPRC